jgi:transcriptional regulator with XRE-family HTH domain
MNGERLAELRKARGFPTQQEFADAILVHQSTVQRWESGESKGPTGMIEQRVKKLLDPGYEVTPKPNLNLGREDSKSLPEEGRKPTRQEYGVPIYGAPIYFKGLRNAPLNEQGVVYLFALVADKLGFTVEAIGTKFPDCQAKMRIDKRGVRWRPVRIEFEYLSSHFKNQKHPAEGCDVIVCWKNDWSNCPPHIQVIELSTAIRKLGARFQE